MNGHETGRRTRVARRSGVTGLTAVVATALALTVAACGGGSSGGGTSSAKTAASASTTSSSTTIATATNLANQPAPTVPSSSSAGGGSKSAGGGAVAAGKRVFQTTCGSCHTLAAAQTSGHLGPNLDHLKPNYATVHHQVINGGGGMPAFGSTLSKTQIKSVALFVSSVAGKPVKGKVKKHHHVGP